MASSTELRENCSIVSEVNTGGIQEHSAHSDLRSVFYSFQKGKQANRKLSGKAVRG
jgi:hypothetical protein